MPSSLVRIPQQGFDPILGVVRDRAPLGASTSLLPIKKRASGILLGAERGQSVIRPDVHFGTPCAELAQTKDTKRLRDSCNVHYTIIQTLNANLLGTPNIWGYLNGASP